MSNYNRVYDYDQILQWIIQYKTTHDGVGPSMREMVKGCGLRSTSHAQWILERLQQDGKIRITPGQPRAIQVVGGEWVYKGE